MTDPDQGRLGPKRQQLSDGELSDCFDALERSIEIETNANYRMGDNHLKHADRVIANKAALSTIRDSELIVRALSQDPLP